jgi:methionyl-tRNA formyltransferase
VATGEGWLGLGEVQAAGKRRLPAGQWLRGARLEPGARLGEE